LSLGKRERAGSLGTTTGFHSCSASPSGDLSSVVAHYGALAAKPVGDVCHAVQTWGNYAQPRPFADFSMRGNRTHRTRKGTDLKKDHPLATPESTASLLASTRTTPQPKQLVLRRKGAPRNGGGTKRLWCSHGATPAIAPGCELRGQAGAAKLVKCCPLKRQREARSGDSL